MVNSKKYKYQGQQHEDFAVGQDKGYQVSAMYTMKSVNKSRLYSNIRVV